MEADESAEVRRRVDAPPERVFAAFADPRLVSRWLKPGPEVRLEVLTFDFRVGGTYRFAYGLPDGGVMHVNGAFREIEPPSRIAFSWNIEPPDAHAGVRSEVFATITPSGSGAEIHIRHEKLAQAGASERHAEGWRGALHLMAVLFGAQEGARGG